MAKICRNAVTTSRRRVPAVADAPHGHEPGRSGGVGLDLLAQPAYVHGHGRPITDVPAPHLAHELVPGEHRTRPGEQESEQVELTIDQRKLGPSALRTAGSQVNAKVAVAKDPRS